MANASRGIPDLRGMRATTAIYRHIAGDRTTKAYAYYEWMDEAKEEWMPEIYCLGAPTPKRHTWSRWLNEDCDERCRPKKRKPSPSVVAPAGGGKKEIKKGKRKNEVAKLAHPPLYLPL
ncbi:hypothetical protein KM043_016564 [Ampulex compressa]|nr:hypothetical protein KM043_016564 [Ampulex compressa]